MASPFKTRSQLAAFFLFPLLLIIFSEWIAGYSLFGIFEIFKHDFRVGIFSYLWILTIQSFLFVISPRYVIGFFSSVLGIVTFIHAQKLTNLGEPLYPTDLFVQAWAVGNLSIFANVFGQWQTYVVFLTVGFLWFLGFFLFRNVSIPPLQRTLAGVGLGIILWSVTFNVFGTLSGIQKITGLLPAEYSWRQAENYRVNGFLGGFLTNLGNINIEKPSGYSEESMGNLRGKFATIWSRSDSPFRISDASSRKPNVIVILSESFWDVTQLPNVRFDPDPLRNFRAISMKMGGGRMISPTFGGKTALVEFELLTGNSMAFLPNGSVPYQQYIKKPIPAIPWEFKKHGYDTVAIHTYEKNFFNRANAYPLLGFDRFIGKEDIAHAKYRGPFISDATFTDEILKQLRNPDRKKPIFVFGISMENHFSYEGHKFDTLDVSVSSSSLTDNDIQTVRNYAQGIHDADYELGRLVSELRNFNEPTYILFFGDHLWILGENFGAYVRSGFISSKEESKWSEKERLSMYTPPFVVWNNFRERGISSWNTKGDFGNVRSSFLGNLLLDTLGAENKNPNFNFISEMNECFSSSAVFLSLNETIPKEKCSTAMLEYEILQYGSLFGKDERESLGTYPLHSPSDPSLPAFGNVSEKTHPQ